MTGRHWMPLYVAEYIADTGHLSTLEHGAYMLLIMHYWQNGGLPNEDRKLANICRLSESGWLKIKPTIKDHFEDGWRHKRIETELAHAEHVMNKRKAAGRASAEAKRSTRSTNAQHVLNECGHDERTNYHVYVDVDATDQNPLTIQEETSPRASEPQARIEFDMIFWPAYPHKVGRREALFAFIAIRRRFDLATVMDGLDRYVGSKPPDQQWLNPSNFLEKERFNDQPAASPVSQSTKPHDAIFDALAREASKGFGPDGREADPDGGIPSTANGDRTDSSGGRPPARPAISIVK